MFKEIIDSLSRNKLRTALTGLSVSVGIFLLIFLLGAGNGIIHAFEHNSGQMGSDVMTLYAMQTSVPYDGLAKGRAVEFNNADVERSHTAGGHMVTAASGKLYRGMASVSNGDKAVSASLEGVYPANAHIENVVLVAGRYINDLDQRQRRKVLVIGERAATELCGSAAQALGRTLSVDGIAYRVVGVVSDKGQMGQMTGRIPFSTLQAVYRMDQEVHRIELKTRDAATPEANVRLQSAIRHALAAAHRFSPDDHEAVWMWSSAAGAREMARAMDMLRTSLWVLGLLTLLSGVVGISNIMLITVRERTHEFGIRKALGARSWSILRSVMAESVVITAISGYVGLVAGIAATEWLNIEAGRRVFTVVDVDIFVFLDPTVDMAIALKALGVLVVAGLVAGFFPAWRAVRIRPIEALNSR